MRYVSNFCGSIFQLPDGQRSNKLLKDPGENASTLNRAIQCTENGASSTNIQYIDTKIYYHKFLKSHKTTIVKNILKKPFFEGAGIPAP